MNKELEFLEEKHGDNSWGHYPPSKREVAQWLQEYTNKQLRLYGVSNRLSPAESTNVLRKPKLVQISTDLKNILSKKYDSDYDGVEDVKFIEKYSGKKVIVYEWCGDWWIAEDDNYPITEKCFEDLPNGY
jgi:hypothetical protein